MSREISNPFSTSAIGIGNGDIYLCSTAGLLFFLEQMQMYPNKLNETSPFVVSEDILDCALLPLLDFRALDSVAMAINCVINLISINKLKG